jgi:hypothetical protein
MGGRKTLVSGWVMSSGYIPPVDRARRNKVSELETERRWSTQCIRRGNYSHSKPFRGKRFYARVCVTLRAIGVELQSTLQYDFAVNNEGSLSRTLIGFGELDVGLGNDDTRSDVPPLLDLFLEYLRTRCPRGSNATILDLSNHTLFGGISAGGLVNE